MIVEISERMSSEVNFGATVTTPTGFDPEKESLPMIVFLHGAGERGEDLSIVNKVGLPKYFTADPDSGHTPVAAVSGLYRMERCVASAVSVYPEGGKSL